MAATKRTRRARGSLSREEILTGATSLIEKNGLENLSMPGLARKLDSGVTSIYWYFRSKEELLVALAVEVTGELYARLPPVSGKAWDEELESYFFAFRNEAKRTHVYLELFKRYPRFLLSHPDVSKTVIPRLEEEIAVLVRGGLTPDEAAHTYSTCSVYTRGFVLLEHDLLSEGDKARSDIDQVVSGLDASDFPNLTQLASFESAMSLDDASFRFGLRLLISGIRAQFESLDDSLG